MYQEYLELHTGHVEVVLLNNIIGRLQQWLKEETLFWYNFTPRSGQIGTSVLQRQVYTYEWRHPLRVPETEKGDLPSTIKMGDEV